MEVTKSETFSRESEGGGTLWQVEIEGDLSPNLGPERGKENKPPPGLATSPVAIMQDCYW